MGASKPNDSSRASVRADTQADAYRQTRDIMARNGGGELSVQGSTGRSTTRIRLHPPMTRVKRRARSRHLSQPSPVLTDDTPSWVFA
ncbi:DUF2188 domain-containing protein [Leifsonia sp. NPDC058194]|uniref:DUF2188 domain-containing protein n=1 Tax=Leifsonia sp. NPDC058194 TaxID=3346374 RepID=UPI0036DEB044